MFVEHPLRRAAAVASLVVALSTLSAVGQMDWHLVTADYPRWRIHHAMVGDTARQRIVLFGGYALLADTWEWDGTRWTLRAPPVSPSARAGHAMAYDAPRKRTVLFGGGFGATPVNDTWEWDGTTWTQCHPAVSPPARSCHALAYDASRKRVVLFGGVAGTGQNAYALSDTWEWDGASWTRRTPATSPPASSFHAMAYDPGRKRIVAVGTGTSVSSSIDTWEWDGNTWTKRTPTTVPPGRYYHAIAYDPTTKRILLHGGIISSTSGPVTLADTWTWDGVDWTHQFPQVNPPPNGGHVMAPDPAGGRLLDFGGFYSRDTWAWTGSNWAKVASPVGTPPARRAHATADDPARQRVVLFGGWDGTTRFDDTWTWDGRRWTAPRPSTKPAARHSHAMAFDPVRKRVVLFGGNGGGARQDTWEWDGTDWLRIQPSKSPPARQGHAMVYDGVSRRVLLFGGFNGTYLNDTWTWDGKDWSRRAPATSPPGRSNLGMAYDAARRCVVLFGGDSGVGVFADTWEWNGANWKLLQPPGGLRRRCQHAMAYDLARQRVVLHGGVEYTLGPHSRPTYFADTWEWDGTRWTQQSPSSQPPMIVVAQPMTYDSTRGRMILSCAGDLETWAYAPTDLTASAHSVSVATGGRVVLSIDAGAAHAGKVYWILGCAEGQGPRGIPSLRVNLLLNPDPYFWFTAHFPNPLIRGALGILDGAGRAAATIQVPPLPPGLVGSRFYHAYVVFTTRIDYASTPVPLTLVK